MPSEMKSNERKSECDEETNKKRYIMNDECWEDKKER